MSGKTDRTRNKKPEMQRAEPRGTDLIRVIPLIAYPIAIGFVLNDRDPKLETRSTACGDA